MNITYYLVAFNIYPIAKNMLHNIVYDTSHHGNVLRNDSDLHVENVTNEQSYKYGQWRVVKSNVRQDVFS